MEDISSFPINYHNNNDRPICAILSRIALFLKILRINRNCLLNIASILTTTTNRLAKYSHNKKPKMFKIL